ncbi:unnamed protein product, partial [Clonostachys byssicola]
MCQRPASKISDQTLSNTAKMERRETGKKNEVTENMMLALDDTRGPSTLEHSITVRQAVHHYRWAIFWCLAVSMTVVMEGYDTILLGNLWAYPTFQQKYGEYVGVSSQTRSGYQLTPAWQAGLGNAAGVGAFFGALLNGILVNRFGQRNTIVGALMALSCFIFIVFFSQNPQVLLTGQLLCGIPWGVFATSAPAYASEMLPMVLRVYFTSWTNMCFIIGQFIASGVLRVCLSRDDEWGFRIPFALQWFWPAWLIPILMFAPESPWHLVRQGKLEEAERSINRLQASDCPISHKQALMAIVETNKAEKDLAVGTSYKHCFKGVELRRTEIACMCFMGQVLCGLPIAYNATYFYEQIGLPANITYSLNIGGYGLALFSAFCSWFFLLPRVGRRKIYLGGAFTMSLLLYLIAILTSWKQHHGVTEAQAYLTIVWKAAFQLSAGQLGWAIPAEVGSTRLRQKTIVLARNSYYLVHTVGTSVQPYFLNPRALDLGARAAFVWATTALLFFTWAFFRLPETKNLTYEELNRLFAQRVPSREFAKTEAGIVKHRESERLASVATGASQNSAV